MYNNLHVDLQIYGNHWVQAPADIYSFMRMYD